METSDVAALINRLRELEPAQRGAAAVSADFVARAAAWDRSSPEYLRLVGELKALKVPVQAFQRAVKIARLTSRGLSLTPTPIDGRPRVVITTEEHDVNDDVIRALAERGEVYQRGGTLVEVIHPAPGAASTVGPVIRPCPPPRVRELLAASVDFTEPLEDRETGLPVYRPAHPPEWCVRAVHSRGRWPGVPWLAGVTETPILRADGSVFAVPNAHDPITGFYYAPARMFPEVPEHVTPDAAYAARDLILELVQDFPFESPEARAAWFAGVLTPLARQAFAGPSPIFVFDANVRGAGKSLLADLTACIVTGRPMSRMVQKDEAEEAKVITCLALEGANMALIDNVSRPLGSGTLDNALTATVWGERVLGVSERPQLPLLATWYATGNNVRFVGDTARRAAMVRIDVREENPETRAGFRFPDVKGYARERRAELVAAALTVLRFWLLQGEGFGGAPWGSYEGWSHVVRGACVAVGLPDPWLARGSAQETADQQAGGLELLVDGLSEAVDRLQPDRREWGVSAGELIAAMEENTVERSRVPTVPVTFGKLREAFSELIYSLPAGKLPNACQLGKLLSAYRGRVVKGRRIVGFKPSDAGGKGGLRWTVLAMPAPAAPPVPLVLPAAAETNPEASGEADPF